MKLKIVLPEQPTQKGRKPASTKTLKSGNTPTIRDELAAMTEAALEAKGYQLLSPANPDTKSVETPLYALHIATNGAMLRSALNFEAKPLAHALFIHDADNILDRTPMTPEEALEHWAQRLAKIPPTIFTKEQL